MSELREPSLPSNNAAERSGHDLVERQQIPHSGNLPGSLREQPVNNFDKTSLSEAVERELLETPTSLSSLPEAQLAPEKKGKRGLIVGLSAGLAGAAIAAGSIIGINALSSDTPENEPPKQDPKGTTEVTAVGEVETEPSTPEEYRARYEASILQGEKLTEHFLIPAGLSDDELGKAVIAKLDEWENYGTNATLIEWQRNRDFSEEAQTLQQIVDELAAENASAILPALVVDGAEANSAGLAGLIPRMQHNNASGLGFYIQTSDDEEPYRSWSEVTNVEAVQVDESSRQLTISFTEYSNTDKNRAHELGMTTMRTHLGQPVEMTFVMVSDGEHERITEVM